MPWLGSNPLPSPTQQSDFLQGFCSVPHCHSEKTSAEYFHCAHTPMRFFCHAAVSTVPEKITLRDAELQTTALSRLLWLNLKHDGLVGVCVLCFPFLTCLLSFYFLFILYYLKNSFRLWIVCFFHSSGLIKLMDNSNESHDCTIEIISTTKMSV